MLLPTNMRGLICILTVLILSLSTYAVDDQSKQKVAMPEGTPILWKEPTDIQSRDLFLGPGGEAMKPDLSKVTFVEEEKGGYSTKYVVRDGADRKWTVKIGKEAQSETAASRLLWAVGYYTDITYLVPSTQIEGKGDFQNVRFEARPKEVKRLGEWKWKDNPFGGTPELEGLKVMMALINNWDTKDSNNRILQVRDEETGRDELRYIISDLGATFGKTKDIPLIWRFKHSRSEPGDFSAAKFIDGVKGGTVNFHYIGQQKSLINKIKVEHVRWIASRLARLSEQQISDAFRAANYSAEEVQMLTEAIRARIDELAAIAPEGVVVPQCVDG